MVLTLRAVRRNSPCSGRPSISSAIVLDRSPLATAPITRAISVVGWIMSPTSVLMLSTQVSHPPDALFSLARWLMRPSLPMATLSRLTSVVRFWFSSTTSLKAAAISPSIPVRSSGSRTEKSPLRSCRKAISRTLGSNASAVSTIAVMPFPIRAPAHHGPLSATAMDHPGTIPERDPINATRSNQKTEYPQPACAHPSLSRRVTAQSYIPAR